MIVYEVNLLVDEGVAVEFEDWLGPHIAEVLALDGFLRADWLRQADIDKPGEPGARSWTVLYWLQDMAALAAYLERDAERMRADGRARFGERFSATRRVHEVVRGFGESA